jgi:hypothetical protein
MTKWPAGKDIEKILKKLDEKPELYSRCIPDDLMRLAHAASFSLLIPSAINRRMST